MSADRELLELAAKAAGILLIRSRLDDPINQDMLISDSPRNKGQISGAWNPLTDDGDALRLAVRLGALVGTYAHYSTVDLLSPNERIETTTVWHHEVDGDACAATRRAIVRAAAEIGKAMP